jgi:hypothetical protein
MRGSRFSEEQIIGLLREHEFYRRTKANRNGFSGNAKNVLLGGAIAAEAQRSGALQR